MCLTTDIYIERLDKLDIRQVTLLLAESMCTNPNHVSVFGKRTRTAIEKQRRMFELVLSNPKNISYTAKVNDKIVGSMTYTTPGYCQIPKPDILKSLPKYIKMFGRDIFSVLRWRSNWAKHDLAAPHVHFGPLAVNPSYQGKGIGSRLLIRFCLYLDESNQVGYLETDKEENLPLYKKFGFDIIETDTLFGAKNWFMVRPAKEKAHHTS